MDIKKVILSLVLLVFVVDNSSAIICNPNLPSGCPDEVVTSLGGGGEGNSSENTTYYNTQYWRLDGTNDPPSADWDMGNKSFTGLHSIFTEYLRANTAHASYITSTDPHWLSQGAWFNSNEELTFGGSLIDQFKSRIYADGNALMFRNASQYNFTHGDVNVEIGLRVAGDFISDSLGDFQQIAVHDTATFDQGFIVGSGGYISTPTIYNTAISKGLFFNSQNMTSNFTWSNFENITAKNICYSNGTNCLSTPQNNTNIAFKNESNVFTVDQNVTGTIHYNKSHSPVNDYRITWNNGATENGLRLYSESNAVSAINATNPSTSQLKFYTSIAIGPNIGINQGNFPVDMNFMMYNSSGLSYAILNTRTSSKVNSFVVSSTDISAFWKTPPTRNGQHNQICAKSYNSSSNTLTCIYHDGTNGQIYAGSGGLNIYNNVTMGNLLQLSQITLPTCSSGLVNTFGANTTGTYGCNSSTWIKLF